VGFDRCRAQGELVIVRLQCTDEARAMLFLYDIPFEFSTRREHVQSPVLTVLSPRDADFLFGFLSVRARLKKKMQ
jgi:hypothetical protein